MWGGKKKGEKKKGEGREGESLEEKELNRFVIFCFFLVEGGWGEWKEELGKEKEDEMKFFFLTLVKISSFFLFPSQSYSISS